MGHLPCNVLPVATLYLLLSASACTTLGPMPSTTGIAMAPAARPDVEVHAGLVPGYYLSSAVEKGPSGAPVRELGAVLEPDRLISVPGLIVGARYAGEPATGAAPEPLVGYRATVGTDHSLGVAFVAFGTHAQASQKQASFSATRGGAEVGGDLRLTPESSWVELHLDASAALTGLSAHGSYCLDQNGKYGADCPDTGAVLTGVNAGGFYPSVNAGVSLTFAQHMASAFHGGRLDLGVGGGTMPRVLAGEQGSGLGYATAGATLTLGFGATH
jgi:hypothetical protein